MPTLWWWFPEMTALFILMSVIIGLIGRLSEVELTDAFVNGARDLLGCRAHHRHRARHHRDHEQRRRDRHRAALGRAGGGRTGPGGLRDRGVPALPAPVVPDPLIVGSGHRVDADHGSAGGLRGRRGQPDRHGLPERIRPDEPVHPDVCGGDGRSGDRAGALRHLSALGVAVARHAGGTLRSSSSVQGPSWPEGLFSSQTVLARAASASGSQSRWRPLRPRRRSGDQVWR